jgi:hypothetical protein
LLLTVKECDDMHIKRPWEIYLDLLVLAGWSYSFVQQFEYTRGYSFVRADAFRRDAILQGTGKTLDEAVINLMRQFINLNIEDSYVQ